MRLLTVLVMIGLAVGVLLTPAAALASFGIDPGKVYIDNLYPGAQAEFPVTIYNQNDYEATFLVAARTPDYTAEDEGYEALPYLEWIVATPDRITIGASDTSDVLITVAMPDDVDYSGKRSEVWISFKEEGTPGMVKIELASRIFISTRVEEPTEPEEPAEPDVPAVDGSGAVGITAEAVEPEPVAPQDDPAAPGANSLSIWVILSPMVGVVLLGAFIFFLRRRRSA
ncbi:hypothetical protein ACFLX7_05385 [Chloroflexota bacterium]